MYNRFCLRAVKGNVVGVRRVRRSSSPPAEARPANGGEGDDSFVGRFPGVALADSLTPGYYRASLQDCSVRSDHSMVVVGEIRRGMVGGKH